MGANRRTDTFDENRSLCSVRAHGRQEFGWERGKVYDVVSVWDGASFRLEDHLARFERNCERLRLRLLRARDDLRKILIGLIKASELREAYVETSCTLGQSVNGSRDPRTCINCF